MTLGVVLGPVVDPHCGRDSDDYLSFSVGREDWRVQWGRFDAFGTAAYWVDQTIRGDYADKVELLARSADLQSETIFCLLGGYGVTAESAKAAHSVVMGVLQTQLEAEPGEIESALRRPLPGGLGRYRFPRQRATRVVEAVRRLRMKPPPEDPLLLREYLLGINGIGPKTAAWIVRNVTGTPEVAIIDIWLIRALTLNGIFRRDWRVDRHYERYEGAFFQYAAHGRVLPGALDLCIWEQARRVGHSHFAAT
ncbi:MAG: hypothetical protein OXH61_07355 [Acidimicrobiaceae bacterium]|nr:hypothetical protein [Acidimicrobiaceae bacterium]